MARSLEIPAIVGTSNATQTIKKDDYLVLDAINNKIIINPSDEELEALKNYQRRVSTRKRRISQTQRFTRHYT
ncbi:phosphoenolpyruvate-protein phosphotransferase [Proteus vulgaris]|nr:phosphoenolpyruvate-protein phosphotransferase [Proteus vulgaris]